MSFPLPRGRGSSPLLRILKSNHIIRPRLPVSCSGLYIKSSPFSSHAVLSRPRTTSSMNAGNIGVSRRPGCVDSVTNMHRQSMQGVRLNSTSNEAGTEKKVVKQGLEKDEAVKAEESEEETDEESEEKLGEEAMETVKKYKARFPAIHDITVRRKTGQKGKETVFEENSFKTCVTLQGRKKDGRKPRVWVSFSEDKIPAEVASMQWPTGREGATKATLFDYEEVQHDMRCEWPMGDLMEFQVTEKTLVKGDRKIWREVIREGGLIYDDSEEGE